MRAIVLFIFLFLIWLVLTFNVENQNILVGAVIAVLATALMSKYSLKPSKKILNPVRYLWAIIYGFIFLWECIKANLDVAYRVLHPGLPVKPGIVKAKSTLKSDVAKVFLANSITMTPGTITVDIKDDEFFVHWIYVYSKDEKIYTQKILGRFEKYLKRIFE
ncbi:MAG: Na+/H+ antiporter subunit D [Spirochaetes bacterium]|nr:MAG: Na+/H+ antiporter subunit D [Spirochaetota bacterium]